MQQREGGRESSRAEVPLQKLVKVMLFGMSENLSAGLVLVSWLGLIKTGLIFVSNALKTSKDTAVCSEPEENCIFFFSEVSACIFCLPLLLMQALTKHENFCTWIFLSTIYAAFVRHCKRLSALMLALQKCF